MVLFCLFIYFGECAFFNKGIKSNNVSHNSFVLFSWMCAWAVIFFIYFFNTVTICLFFLVCFLTIPISKPVFYLRTVSSMAAVNRWRLIYLLFWLWWLFLTINRRSLFESLCVLFFFFFNFTLYFINKCLPKISSTIKTLFL